MEIVCLRLVGGYLLIGVVLLVSRKFFGRGLLLLGWGEYNARYRVGTFLWVLFCVVAVVYWRRCVGVILVIALGICVVSVFDYVEVRNFGNG